LGRWQPGHELSEPETALLHPDVCVEEVAKQEAHERVELTRGVVPPEDLPGHLLLAGTLAAAGVC